MNARRTHELTGLAHGEAAPGLDRTQSEVTRESLRQHAEQARSPEAHLEKLRGALATGIKQADRGELLDGAQIVAEMRELVAKPE